MMWLIGKGTVYVVQGVNLNLESRSVSTMGKGGSREQLSQKGPHRYAPTQRGVLRVMGVYTLHGEVGCAELRALFGIFLFRPSKHAEDRLRHSIMM